ncbi:hypothetical protein [Amycolatopsis keratiniphila]|uniref:hypothetical protein n=1 Tax=Amycolatopsis keratiniphila TaxID=129921 RepID=UPI00087BDAFC|nr:hypothetical protein [Amycolatopsis keratiniphila]OLZ56298.1 hypothetical protein BS330_19560 [Amycolatopsis keratiniphila subsp. nogabecina]SDU53123.1 hypothetical protein SAMN04489733_5576 [Amycolatopsis keratiniphila]
MTDGTGGPPGNFSDMLGDFSAQADAMVTAAKEGRFKVSEEAGEALKTAIDDYIDDWTNNQRHFNRLAEKPKLGTGPFAQQVGHHASLVADGDELSAKKQLDALQDVLNRAKAAIELAKVRYRQRDSDNADQLKIPATGLTDHR